MPGAADLAVALVLAVALAVALAFAVTFTDSDAHHLVAHQLTFGRCVFDHGSTQGHPARQLDSGGVTITWTCRIGLADRLGGGRHHDSGVP